jgi:hypothetical protein
LNLAERAGIAEEIVLPALAGLDLSEATKAHLEGFDAEKEVAVHVSGASHAKVAVSGSLDYDVS